MKPLLDLSVGLDRAQSPQQYLLKSNTQVSNVDQIIDDSNIMHYYGSLFNLKFFYIHFKNI